MDGLGADENHFIREIAALLAPWGMPVMAGRVYGYLLLNPAPVSVNQIATDLRTSKVAAWNAARSLEEFGHVRRYGEPGSKRALYGPTGNFDVPMVKQCALLGSLGALLQNSASAIAQGDVASRLQEMARFYLSMRKAMEATIQELNANRRKRRG
jgi:hypothetical protein